MSKFIKKAKETVSSVKNHSKQYFKTNVLFTTFVITSLVNSCLLRFLTIKKYFDFQPIIADLAIILIIGSIGYFIKPKHQFKYFFIWSIIFTAICVINSMYFTNYKSYASFSLLATSFQIVDVGDAIVDNVMEMKDFSYIWQVIAMIIVHITLKHHQYYEAVTKTEKGKKMAKGTFLTGMIVAAIFICTLSVVDLVRFSKQWNREFTVRHFGIYTYQFEDLILSLRPQISPLWGYDKASKEVREYYDNQDTEQKTNEYTDIFKGKNLLVIHAESIQNFTLFTEFNGKEVTPVLNQLAKQGLYFSNFYAQESVGTSSDTEFTLNTSLLPTSNGTVFMNYWDRNYVTIPKLLKEQGYYAFSMHGNKCDFWNRNVVHQSFGYDNFYCSTKDFTIDETIGLGLSDKSFFRQAVPKIKNISDTYQNFYGTMLMLTNHTPWGQIDKFSDYQVTMSYQEVDANGQAVTKTAPYLEGTILGRYIKSVNYADAALGQFLEDLDKQGLLENTVIVIYGDHDAKIKKAEYDRYYNYDPKTDSILNPNDPGYQEFTDYDYELNRKVPFIIWSKNDDLSKEITSVMGMYDVLPTLGNRFGFSSPYALGSDVFSTDNNVVVFPNGNWLTDHMYYNSQKQEGILLHANQPVSVDYIEKYIKIAESKVAVSNDLILYDLIPKNYKTQFIENKKG